MTDRSPRRLWATVVSLLVACLAACSTTATDATTAVPPAQAPTPAAVAPLAPPVRVLQLNLCSSGIADCYTGRSTAAAAAAVRTVAPSLVTLNEVCQDDVAALERALADVVPAGGVTSAFQAARDARTGEPYRCRNGQQYGVGLVSRWPAVAGPSLNAGIYPAQDTEDPEERAWLCLEVAAGPTVVACTTHLAYTKREVALAQCRYLFDTVIARMRARDGASPVVVGGDLNLGSGDSPDLVSCLPQGSAMVDDEGQQHVVGTPEFVVDGSETLDLGDTTDHPGLLVTLAARVGPRGS
jgi:endonuclease/exonuclease/phosphatase family metal-dependent hydrolase